MAGTRIYLFALIAFFTIAHSWAGAPLITALKSAGHSGVVRITCLATGIPEPTVSWKFKGNILSKNSHYSFRYSNQSMLVIRDTTEADSGVYRCLATNMYGTIYGETRLKIRVLGEFKKGFQQYDECQYRNVTVGKPYELQCPPHTKSYAQQWFVKPLQIWKAGTPLPRIFQALNGSLIFSFVKKDDITLIARKGGLTCGLIVDLKIVPSVSIKLHDDGNEFTGTAKPTIVVFMKKETIGIEKKTIKLLCGAIGKPHPHFQWTKDGKLVNNNDISLLGDHMKVEGKGMVLNFRSLKMSDGGVYKCVATNSDGQDSKEGTLVVNTPVKWIKHLHKLMHWQIPVNQPIVLECKAEGKPKPKYIWKQNETVITSSGDRNITGGLLKVTAADFNDAGFYLCIVSNYINTQITAAYVSVEAFKPTFNTLFKKATYFLQEAKGELYCDATGGPWPTISWYHNAKRLPNRDARLVFDKPDKTRNGVYKCIATNVDGFCEQSTNVKIFAKTIIKKGPAKVSFKVEAQANLFCKAQYDDTLKVTYEWLKNGKRLNYDDRVTLKKGITWATQGLQINKLQLSDVGTYTCRVFTVDTETFRSQDEKTGSITVLGPPRKPRNVKMSGDCTTDATITLSWTAPSEFVGPTDHYIVQYAHVDDLKKWFTYKTATPIKATSLEIITRNLPVSVPLIFRVQAVSVIEGKKYAGNACEGTKVGSCVTAGGIPFAPPMGLKAEMDTEGNVTVSWDKFDKILQARPGFKIVGKYKKDVNGTTKEDKEVEVAGDATSFKIPVGKSEKNDDIKFVVEVQARNKKGSGPKAKITIEHPANMVLPSKVGNVIVVKSSVTSSSVTLKWDPVTTATGYEVYYLPKAGRKRRAAPEIKTKKFPVGNGGKVDGLKSNTNYEVTVAATNLKGIGDASDPVEVKTKKGVPGVPTNVVLKTYGQAIVLGWSPPADDDKNVTSYDLTWYKTDDPTTKHKKKPALPPTAQKAFITDNLKPLEYYTVELAANSDAGKGKPWKIEGVVVGKPDIPGKPPAPKLTPVNASIINVTLDLPTPSKGGLPNKFKVYYVKEGSPDSEIKNVTVPYPTKSSVLLTPLDFATYSVWASGENANGVGENSTKVSGKPALPTMPPTTTDVPLFLNATIAAGRSKTDDECEDFWCELWFIILILILLLILIILLLLCWCCRKAGKYPVGEKENKFGGWDNQQLQDYSDNPMDTPNGLPFKDEKAPMRSASENSLQKVPIIDDNDDTDSLDYYGEDNKFAEDGSFIGEYGDDKQLSNNDAVL